MCAILLRLAYGIHGRLNYPETEVSAMTPNPKDQKWRDLAQDVITETDPARLHTLVAQLCTALDERIKPYQIEAQGR
jgi:hypothetical protein